MNHVELWKISQVSQFKEQYILPTSEFIIMQLQCFPLFRALMIIPYLNISLADPSN